MGDPKKGLIQKFIVKRADGKHRKGQKHDGCDYFVLDLTHDRYAVGALRTYAKECAKEYPLLARDLLQTADRIAPQWWRPRPGPNAAMPSGREE